MHIFVCMLAFNKSNFSVCLLPKGAAGEIPVEEVLLTPQAPGTMIPSTRQVACRTCSDHESGLGKLGKWMYHQNFSNHVIVLLSADGADAIAKK